VRRRHRIASAVVASLAIHALLLGLMWRYRDDVQRPLPASRHPLPVEIVGLPIPDAVHPLPDVEEAAPGKEGARKRVKVARPPPADTARPKMGEDAVTEGESIPGAQSEARAATDTPRGNASTAAAA
jgi:hypothetical protein